MLLLPKKGPKTDFHLIAVYREGYGWVFLHSGYHSLIAQKLIESRFLPEFRDAVAYGKEFKIDNHRIDFVISYHTGDVLMEVKGCTFFKDRLALFPDAPTKRGAGHVKILSEYGDSILLFLSMNDNVDYFAPNADTDKIFHKAVLEALAKGVHVIPATFSFDGSTLRHVDRIPFVSDPYDDELFSLANIASEAAEEYTERFGPEANAVLAGVSRIGGVPYIHVVFYGVFCQSCGLYDYFDDYGLVLGDYGVPSGPEDVKQFGNTYVVRFKVKEVQ
ncbi:MAG: sugar fermentation stimulation protein [Candidatus Diapherotrites archaeon]|nr:sugar fermentation stimulation protein [Candidatus Diapherotrites archaeon]MDN5367237.1 sugar fermentation stimulation protein [Candidatus Diapherotrites archaeon]